MILPVFQTWVLLRFPLVYAFVSFLDLVISAKIFLALESFKNVTRALYWPVLDTVTSLDVGFVSLSPFKSQDSQFCPKLRYGMSSFIPPGEANQGQL